MTNISDLHDGQQLLCINSMSSRAFVEGDIATIINVASNNRSLYVVKKELYDRNVSPGMSVAQINVIPEIRQNTLMLESNALNRHFSHSVTESDIFLKSLFAPPAPARLVRHQTGLEEIPIPEETPRYLFRNGTIGNDYNENTTTIEVPNPPVSESPAPERDVAVELNPNPPFHNPVIEPLVIRQAPEPDLHYVEIETNPVETPAQAIAAMTGATNVNDIADMTIMSSEICSHLHVGNFLQAISDSVTTEYRSKFFKVVSTSDGLIILHGIETQGSSELDHNNYRESNDDLYFDADSIEGEFFYLAR